MDHVSVGSFIASVSLSPFMGDNGSEKGEPLGHRC